MRQPTLLLFMLLAATPAAAQNLTPEPFTDREVGIEFLRPMFEDDDLDALSFATYFYTRIPIGSVHLLADLPFVRMSADGLSSTGLGNLMVGLSGTRGKGTMYGTVRFPTASDDEPANLLAILGDIQRVEAWLPDVTTLSVGAILRDNRPSGHGFHFLLGAAFLLPDEGENEVVLDYGAQWVYRPSALGLTVGLQGRAGVTGDGDFGERTLHDLRLRVDYTSGQLRPAIGLAVPFDEDVREVLNAVLRLGLQVGI